jgi:hypothetical protein
MDVIEFHRQLEGLKTLMKERGYTYNREAFAFVNHSGDVVTIVARGSMQPHTYGEPDKALSIRGDYADEVLQQARSAIYHWPDRHTLQVERLTRKLGEIAELCQQGACEQDAYQATWEALQQMMRRQQEFITKNGLPAPRDLSNVTQIDAAE